MVHCIGCDTDVRFGVVCQYCISAVRVARAARKIATGDIHLQTFPGSESVMDIAEMNCKLVHLVRHQMLWSCCYAATSRYIARTTPSIRSIARPSSCSSINFATKSVSRQFD